MVTEAEAGWPPIIGQWGLECPAEAMCNQHEAAADNGVASKIITNAEATSLSRHVMFLIILLGPCLYGL
jgi:hypothetical protein